MNSISGAGGGGISVFNSSTHRLCFIVESKVRGSTKKVPNS